jgi:hypothetical protein
MRSPCSALLPAPEQRQYRNGSSATRPYRSGATPGRADCSLDPVVSRPRPFYGLRSSIAQRIGDADRVASGEMTIVWRVVRRIFLWVRGGRAGGRLGVRDVRVTPHLVFTRCAWQDDTAQRSQFGGWVAGNATGWRCRALLSEAHHDRGRPRAISQRLPR